MCNSTWVLAFAIAVATTSFVGLCQEAQPSEPVYTVKVSVDSGEMPFSVVLHGGDVPYLARREARRASSVEFTEVPGGAHRLTVDIPGGRRAELLAEVNAHYAGQRQEVRLSVPWKSFHIVQHTLEHETAISAKRLASEDEVFELLESSWPLIERGDLTAAHSVLRQLVTLAPEFHEGWNNLGAVAERQGFIDEAIKFYRKALRLDADCYLYNMNLSVVLARQYQYAEAIVFGLRAVERNPESLIARLHLGTLCMLAREYHQAIPHLLEVVALNGEHTDTPRLQLGAAYVESGQLGLGAKIFSDWMRAHPKHPKFTLVEGAMQDVAAQIDRQIAARTPLEKSQGVAEANPPADFRRKAFDERQVVAP